MNESQGIDPFILVGPLLNRRKETKDFLNRNLLMVD